MANVRFLLFAAALLGACTELNPDWDPCAAGDPSCNWDAGPQWHGDLEPACGQVAQPCCDGERCYQGNWPVAGGPIRCVELPAGTPLFAGKTCQPCGWEGGETCEIDNAYYCEVGLRQINAATCVR